MNEPVSLFEGLNTGFQTLVAQLMSYLPRIALAVLILVVGWLLARLVRMLVERTIGRLDQLWQRLISKRGMDQLQPRHLWYLAQPDCHIPATGGCWPADCTGRFCG